VVVLDNANIVYGWVDDDSGAAEVLDAHSLGAYGPIVADTSRRGSDDILDHAGVQEGGITTVEFTRRLNTGDELDSSLNPSKGNKLI
jgi:hypothetical protein